MALTTGRDRRDVAVLVPARDEEQALPTLLARLDALGLMRRIVVDNGSRDHTAEVARAGGARVVVEPRPGYGRACLAGLAALRGDPPRAVLFVDADQHLEAAALERLLAPVLAGRADLAVGARVRAEGDVGTLLPHARWGNRIVLLLARLLFGRRWSDLGPLRAVSWSALERLSLDDETWGWTLQMQVRATRAGLRALEVEVPHRRRRAGRSKISGSLLTSLRVGGRMFWTLARERLRAAPPVSGRPRPPRETEPFEEVAHDPE